MFNSKDQVQGSIKSHSYMLTRSSLFILVDVMALDIKLQTSTPLALILHHYYDKSLILTHFLM